MKIALYGGTFDPVHRGHVDVACEAADALALDRVLFVPAGRPPHRLTSTEAGYEHRYRMTALACEADSRFEPSRLETPTSDGKPNYSLDTLRQARSELGPGDRLFFILGCDAFAEIDSWHRWQEVVRATEFIVVSRPGVDLARDQAPADATVHWLTEVDVPVSSTEVRRRLRSGDACDGVLPGSVGRYIREHSLYVPRSSSVLSATEPRP